MLTRRAGTFPLPSDQHNYRHHHHQQQPAPRASSEHDARSEPRTSTTDEAQACFNLILILRNDTQHLIALRNDNIQSLEETVAARPLLTGINEAITAATRSIHELGPFLERHRWPPEPPTCRSPIRLKGLRKRSKSLCVPSATKTAAAGADSNLSPEELFSWTLALTAQHTAVLRALARLEGFLVYGTAALSDEDRRRHDATQSWWQQRRGEFENVGLIQSILQGPRRSLRRSHPCGAGAGASTVRATDDRPEARQIGVAVTSSSPTTTTTAILPSISEHDDGRSDTLTFYEQSVRSGHCGILHGLTARPRARTEGSSEQTHCHHLPCESLDVSLRRPVPRTHPQLPPAVENHTEPPQTVKVPPTQINATTTTTTNTTAIPRLPLSQHNSNGAQRPRIATSPLPPLIGLRGIITGYQPPRPYAYAHGQPYAYHDGNSAVSPVSPCSPVSPISPMLSSPPGLSSQNSSRVSLPSPVSQGLPTVETPYTPLDQQVATMFARKTLPAKNIQPVIHELDSVLCSPVGSMSPVLELGAGPSPVAGGRYSRTSVVQPRQGRGQGQGKGQGREEGEEEGEGEEHDDDRHWPYLAYMARKQAVATSRWSLRRSQSKREG